MSAEVEHRGWDIESNYFGHFLDDPDVDFGEAASEGGVGTFVAAIVALVVLLVAIWGLKLWVTPPTLTFPPAAVQIIQPQPLQRETIGPVTINPGWAVSCFMIDSGRKFMRPNYESPACTPQAAKQRGEW